MSLRDLYIESLRKQTVSSVRLAQANPTESSVFQPVTAEKSEFAAGPSAYSTVKLHLHQQILRRVDISRYDPERDRESFRKAVTDIIQEVLSTINAPLTRDEKERLVEDTLAEAIGLGPLGKLFEDPAVSDVLVNGPYEVFVERFGKLEATDIKFNDNEHLMGLIERIVGRVGRHIDQHSPMVDARLPDGSRVNAIIPPLALNGPSMSIRRFQHKRLEASELIKLGAMGPQMMRMFEGMVSARLNIVISGGTGSGKTTLMNVLSGFIGAKERVITIENAAELKLQKEHVVRLESRPPNIEGKGEVTIRDLVINALRMRPDRIIVGEIRGGEAFDMLQALATGHDGGMTTLHANTSRDALKRLEAMVLMAGMDLPTQAIRQFIVSAVNVIIQVDRMADGTRKVQSVSEVVGIEKDIVLVQDLFVFQQETSKTDRVVGKHVATGVRSNYLKQMELRGFTFDPAMFQRGNAV